MEVYNQNRDKNNSMRDEIREQNAKLKDAPLREKLDYFKEYYLKITIAAVIGIILAGHLAYSVLTTPSDTAFAAFFYNDTGDSSDTGLIDGFVEYMGIDTRKQNAYIDATLDYAINGNDADYDAYIDFERTMAVISTHELDVIIGDAVTADYFSRSGCFHDITTVLPGDLLEKFGDRLYYAESGEDAERIPTGIYVTDAPKLLAYHYYTEKEPILGFIVNSDSLDNAIEFLRYLYME